MFLFRTKKNNQLVLGFKWLFKYIIIKLTFKCDDSQSKKNATA